MLGDLLQACSSFNSSFLWSLEFDLPVAAASSLSSLTSANVNLLTCLLFIIDKAHLLFLHHSLSPDLMNSYQ